MASVQNDQFGLVDLLEFNRQIDGLLAVDIPLTWRGDDSPAVLKSEIERIAGRIAILVGEGKSFMEAWKAVPDISLTYQAAFLGWVHSNRSPSAFDLLKSNITRLPQSRKLWFLNFQLGLVFLLALGVLALWLRFGRMSLLYNDSKLVVGPISRFLESMQSQPVFAMAGCLVALLVWGCVLYLAKIRIAKVSQAILVRESIAQRNWIKSQFVELVSAQSGDSIEAGSLYDSLIQSRNSNSPVVLGSGEGRNELVAAPIETNKKETWLSPHSHVSWSADKAAEKRLSYRVSTLPYTIYFIGSGVVVMGIGLLVFGPLIELLYATLVPGAF